VSVVGRAQQGAEIDTDFYHGGLVYHDDAAVHPARLLLSLLLRARSAGARVVHECAATALRRDGGGFELQTARGVVKARQVLIATNGYTGTLTPWQRRRVIPIGSYQIATEDLGEERVRALLPGGRCVSDTRRVVVYFRPSTDGRRIVFGGRAALAEKNALVVVPRLRQMLAQIFPSLRDVHITHSWVGTVAFTFDRIMHIGQHDGVFHCLGYCGQGVPMAPYFGMRIAQQMLGLPQGRTPLDDLRFPTRPLYGGTPWFLAPSVFWYRTLDTLGL
jgi:glycine/D-amino acid oxidase-like deaminating enzyme